ncbi:MAG TPA: DUF6776 family protein [Steroidobacteraceae bacterium]|nr:DUF6776 family protein [Steroidobacteraceae bacterium]
MDEIPTRLVIRTHTPARRRVALALALLLALVSLYAAFEFGRYRGGFDAVRAATQRADMQARMDRLLAQQHHLQVQLAAAQEAQISDVRERSEVARTIGELQAQVERQQKDLEFYRGLVAPQQHTQADVGVRVQEFHIVAMPARQKYLLRFTLNRTSQPDRPMTGTLAISVAGSQAGTAGTLALDTLTGGPAQVPFNFRYYTNIEQPITLPVAFKPDSVTIEVRPTRKGVAPYRQTFLWEVDPT